LSNKPGQVLKAILYNSRCIPCEASESFGDASIWGNVK